MITRSERAIFFHCEWMGWLNPAGGAFAGLTSVAGPMKEPQMEGRAGCVIQVDNLRLPIGYRA